MSSYITLCISAFRSRWLGAAASLDFDFSSAMSALIFATRSRSKVPKSST